MQKANVHPEHQCLSPSHADHAVIWDKNVITKGPNKPPPAPNPFGACMVRCGVKNNNMNFIGAISVVKGKRA